MYKFFGILQIVAANSARAKPRQSKWAGADFEPKIDVESDVRWMAWKYFVSVA
jgi:hypothetical protein